MNKILIAVALVSPLVAGSVSAFPVGDTHTLRVEGSSVARVVARNRVVDTGRACRYTLQISNIRPPLVSTVRCDIDETKASNAFDCQDNSQDWVDTLVQRAGSCTAFDEFGQRTRVSTLIAGESSSGLSGIFYAATVGDIQSFTLR